MNERAFRTPRVPDNDHTILAIGLNYKLAPKSSVDVAYHHGFVKGAPVNTSTPVAGTITGSYKVLRTMKAGSKVKVDNSEPKKEETT